MHGTLIFIYIVQFTSKRIEQDILTLEINSGRNVDKKDASLEYLCGRPNTLHPMPRFRVKLFC